MKKKRINPHQLCFPWFVIVPEPEDNSKPVFVRAHTRGWPNRR